MAWTHFYCSGTLDESVILEIFIASLRAVGCAATLASAGLWLARRGLMSPSLSKGLSQLSVQLAIPALLFSSVIPSISFELLSYAWPLFLLPALYLFLGAIVGHVVLLLVRPPHDFRLGTVAACTFGNTTGIPIVLLSVLQQSLSHSVFADIADPLLFLSLELVSFPLLQWLVGVALLRRHRDDLLTRFGYDGGGSGPYLVDDDSRHVLTGNSSLPHAADISAPIRRNHPGEESRSAYISMMSAGEDEVGPALALDLPGTSAAVARSPLRAESLGERLLALCGRLGIVVIGRVVGGLLRRIFVPQVVGIVAGGLVGLYGRQYVLPAETAPLGWFYIGISKLGAAAVPINLILLGAALSRTPERSHLPPLTAAGILIGRMVFMPLCGLGVARLLYAAHFSVPYLVADPFWLVCLILTATPTANNVVVMCDLAGENRRAMSAAIFYQYCAAPFLLPGVLTLFISFVCETRRESD